LTPGGEGFWKGKTNTRKKGGKPKKPIVYPGNRYYVLTPVKATGVQGKKTDETRRGQRWEGKDKKRHGSVTKIIGGTAQPKEEGRCKQGGNILKKNKEKKRKTKRVVLGIGSDRPSEGSPPDSELSEKCGESASPPGATAET